MSKKIISTLLLLAMLLGAFASCNGTEEITTDGASETTEARLESDTVTSADTEGSATESEAETDATTDSKAEETETDEIDTEAVTDAPLLSGENALIVENADNLKNGVNAYFTDPARKNFTYSNLQMQMEYALSTEQSQQVKYLANSKGKNYITNTMDVYVKMTDGSVHYASDSTIPTAANIYRMGFYFYEIRLEDQVFCGDVKITEEKKISHLKTNDVNSCTATAKDGILYLKTDSLANDPYVVFGRSFRYDADQYPLIQIRMKANACTTGAQLFYAAGEYSGFNATQTIQINVTADGEFHDYLIPLYSMPDYTGTLKALRLDFNGSNAECEIESVKLLAADFGSAPKALSMRRSFNVYSDKMHQIVQVSASETTKNIAEIGILTEIDASTVKKLIAEDKNGVHTSLEDVDWSSATYVGFDIKGTGIFGYILPFDGKGGNISVTLSDGKYIIEQSATPKGNQLIPSVKGTENANDFYIGSRIYTDETHNFDKFLHEAYCERNPLKNSSFIIDEDYSSGATYLGYDSLNGIYKFESIYPAGGFNASYYNEPNKHYRVSFGINGDDKDRRIYVMTYTKGGNLESALLLDSNDVLLPVPIEVGKNYSEESGERNIFNLDDSPYGQAIFPMVIKAKSTDNNYTLINIYQRWGNYPLKEMSWIQFISPYFFTSTGVTETNCILPWFHTQNMKGLSTLPDFRTMSGPFWSTQPQHDSCGTHYWLNYIDENGKTITSESTRNTIDSYGPIYADLTMENISDDGRIKVTYVHSEMPQVDENRVFYEMSYEILEDISFENFSRDFQFYSVTNHPAGGRYTKVGYLNENNESVVVKANTGSTDVKYVLGDNCPYFSFFDMDEYQQGYANVALLIYNASFVISGESCEPAFAIINKNHKVALTLDLGKVTFKAGDKITINAMLLPWGSHELEAVWDTHKDQNVRDVRENTMLNPFKATAIANCEIIESVYVPKVRSTNGVSTEFTLSGGQNNCAVRVYGFEKMTVPVIYEKIDGEWKEYIVNSAKNPDVQNNKHYYDGYAIHYDGDGTFSYSFIVEMDEGKERTFKVVADGNYKKWEKESTKIDPADTYKDVVDPESGYTVSDLHFAGKVDAFCGVSSLAQNFNSADSLVYVNYNGKTIAGADVANYGTKEGYYFVLSGWTMVEGGISKYVWSADGGKTWNEVELFGRTLAVGSAAMISGATDRIHNTFTFSEKDTKNVSYQGASAQAPKGIAANLKDYAGQTVDVIFAAVPVQNEKTLCPFIVAKNITVKAADEAESEETETEEKENSPVYNEYVKEGSGYSVASLKYASCLDMLNGRGPNGSDKFSGRGGNSKIGVDVIQYNGGTLPGGKLIVTGWSVIEGGVSKYVWSVDGGKTWTACTEATSSSLVSATQAHLNGVTSRIGESLDERSLANAVYQGTVGLTDPSTVKGLSVDLSAYAGQTVNLIFAAVPASDTSTLCVLHYITGISVSAQ